MSSWIVFQSLWQLDWTIVKPTPILILLLILPTWQTCSDHPRKLQNNKLHPNTILQGNTSAKSTKTSKISYLWLRQIEYFIGYLYCHLQWAVSKRWYLWRNKEKERPHLVHFLRVTPEAGAREVFLWERQRESYSRGKNTLIQKWNNHSEIVYEINL